MNSKNVPIAHQKRDAQKATSPDNGQVPAYTVDCSAWINHVDYCGIATPAENWCEALGISKMGCGVVILLRSSSVSVECVKKG
jgi:hypothetical protein